MQSKNNTELSIVMYHYVRDLKNSRYPNIKGLDVELFREQLNYIQKHYTIIRMEDLILSIENNKKLPNKPILLTFDDGYKDHFDIVFPILNELGIQGSFFPVTNPIEDGKVLDVNKIHFILATQENEELLIQEIYSLLNKYRERFKLKSNEYYFKKLAQPGRWDNKEIRFIKRLLQNELPNEPRKLIINKLFEKYVSIDEETFAKELYMSKDQLKCLVKNGMHVGSHTVNHVWMDKQTPERQEQEIQESIKFLKSLGITENLTMCYPYGRYNETTLALLKKYNFKIGLTTKVDVVRNNTPLELPRLNTNDLPKETCAEPNKWTIKSNNQTAAEPKSIRP